MQEESSAAIHATKDRSVQWSVDGHGCLVDDPKPDTGTWTHSEERAYESKTDVSQDVQHARYQADQAGYSKRLARDHLYEQNPLDVLVAMTPQGDDRRVRILYEWMLDLFADRVIGEPRLSIPRAIVIFERCCSSPAAASWIKICSLQSFYTACWFIAVKYECDKTMASDYCTMWTDYSTTIPELIGLEQRVLGQLGMNLNDHVIEHALFDHGAQTEVERFLAVECWILQRMRFYSTTASAHRTDTSGTKPTVPFYKKRLSEQYADAIQEAHAIIHSFHLSALENRMPKDASASTAMSDDDMPNPSS